MKYIGVLLLFLSLNSFTCPYSQDYFSISVNKNNDLQIEGELHEISDLGDMLYHYYIDNAIANDNNLSSACYVEFSKANCLLEKRLIETSINDMNRLSKTDILYENILKKWNRRLFVMDYLNLKSCRIISDQASIQIKVKAASSYNTYIQVLTEIKKTINKLRDEKARELFNIPYRIINVNQKMSIMKKRKYVLQLLVPERIFDRPITN